MTKSSGAYSPDKALAHPERLKILQQGGQPYPVHLHLILSDLCNLSCPGCAYRLEGYSSNQLFKVLQPDGSFNNNPNRMLDTEFVKQVLRDCVAMGTRAVELTGGGEPTVHPDAPEILAYAQELGLDTALITNGLLLTRMGEAAVRTKWLRISIDAATAETFSKVRPGLGGPKPENFTKVLKALAKARAMRDDLRTDCVIGAGFVVQKGNWRELYDAVRIYREHGADNVRISGIFTPEKDRYFDGWRKEAEDLERQAVEDFSRDGFKVYGRFHEKVEDLQAPPDYDRCSYQHFTTYLGGDGNVYRCCVQSYNKLGLLGSAVEAGGLKALWDSELKRKRMANFNAKSCSHCQFNDKNRNIKHILERPEIPSAPSEGFIHENFV